MTILMMTDDRDDGDGDGDDDDDDVTHNFVTYNFVTHSSFTQSVFHHLLYLCCLSPPIFLVVFAFGRSWHVGLSGPISDDDDDDEGDDNDDDDHGLI